MMLPPSFARAALRFFGVVFSGVLAVALAAAADSSGNKKVPRGLEVLVAADAAPSPEGFRPKPGHPVYYILGQTRQTLGDPIAGVKLPQPNVVEKAVVAELAQQGFVRSEVGGPIPSVYIVVVVGDSNFEEPRIDLDNPLQDGEISPYMYLVNVRALLEKNLLSGKVSANLETLFDPDRRGSPDEQEAKELILQEAMRLRFRASPRFQDKAKIMALVGAEKIDKAVSEQKVTRSEAEKVAWAAFENRYYITLNAFDAMRWRNKEKVLLWRTTMIIDWRKDLAKELPGMLAQGGPVFGSDMAVPAVLDNRDKRKAEVGIGEVKVVPDEKPVSPSKQK